MNQRIINDPYYTARTFLTRVRKQKDEVESSTFRLQFLRSMASRVTSVLSQTPVCHSPNPSAMDDSVARIMDAEQEVADAFALLMQITDEVSAVLKRIQDRDCRRVMELHYISLLSLADITSDLRCSRRWTTELHSKGLQIVQRILEEKEAA